MPEGDLTREEAEALIGSPPEPPPITTAPVASRVTLPLLPATDRAVNSITSGTPQPTGSGPTGLPSEMLSEEQRKTGKTPGIPFNEGGLDIWTDLMAKSAENKDAQIRYLARKFGTENVRLNEYEEPVVRIKNPDTGAQEDIPLNPHKMTVGTFTSLARFAPDVLGAWIGTRLGDKRGVFVKSLLGSIGGEVGRTARGNLTEPAQSDQEAQTRLVNNLANVPEDMLIDLGLTGLVLGKGYITGKGIPNPLAKSFLLKPARPDFTREGVEAAARNQARSGIDPALRPSESSGIPLMAMLEQYMERKPAGASPMIAGSTRREEAAKAMQNWMVDPATLMSDEEVGRRGLTALKRTVEPYETDVALAEFAKGAAEKGATKILAGAKASAEKTVQERLTKQELDSILSGFHVSAIPDKGVPLSETGDILRSKAVALRDDFKAKASELYDKFFENPLAKDPIISGDQLKGSIDRLISELPKVTKEVETETGLLSASGAPIMGTETKRVPISTPIRPRLEELSQKLTDGKVSINDLKQIRTDLDDAIKIGEAIPGVKEGRLKQAYKSVTDAITDGLRQIDDPDLSQAWKDATRFYRDNVDKFTEKNVSRLFKEAEQTSSIGGAEFTKKAIASEDTYKAIRQFYGNLSSEMGALRLTTKNKLLSDSIGAGGLIDGNLLTRQLKGLKDSNPELFKDAFADRGNIFLNAAERLGGFQQSVPIEEVDKILTGVTKGSSLGISGKLISLQTAQKRLNEEYQNEIVSKFLRGNLPSSELQPDRFVSALPSAKLSDVQEVMARLQREDPVVAEQIQRKSVQNLLSEARRTATPTDTMSKLSGEPGDLISGVGISNALGRGDQLAKYKSLLGPLYDPLIDFAKTELLGEERRRVAAGVGMLAPGSAMNAFIKALTPWEGGNKPEGIIKELSGLARDKVVSIMLSSDPLRRWLVSPYAMSDVRGAIQTAIVSEPFIKGMMEEFKNDGALHQAMSILKVAFGTSGKQTLQEGQPTVQGDLSREEATKIIGP